MKRFVASILVFAGIGCRGGKTEPAYAPLTGGNADRGAKVIEGYGCGACHSIPGIDGARGEIGPPLVLFRRRSYVAGRIPNTAPNLVRWLRDPHAIEPGTAMPTLGLTQQEARDVAAYLYTLD